MHASPFVSFGPQVEFEVQNAAPPHEAGHEPGAPQPVVHAPPVQREPGGQSVFELQFAGQLACVPSQTYGAQVGFPGPLVAMQVPSEPLTLHASHGLPHAVLQQKPSTQWPERH